MNDPLLSSYRLTQYLLLFLVREALELDELGKRFCQDPREFLAKPKGGDRIRECVAQVISDIVIDLNAELKEREDSGNPMDYKRELKSPTAVRSLEHSIIPQYQKAVKRGRASSFGQEWDDSLKS